MIDLSVIVPTHDRVGYLPALLESLSAQDYPVDRWELLIVDDGSTDGTLDYLRLCPVSGLPNIVVIPQHQQGAASARNAGAMMSRGNALLFLDDDMLAQPELVGAHARLHMQHPSAVLIGHVLTPGDRREAWVAWEDVEMKRHFNALASDARKPGPRDFYSGNCSVSTDLFYRIAGYDANLPRAEDIDLGYRLQAAGAHFYYDPTACSTHLGRHTYEGWLRNAGLYGKCDVMLAWWKDGHAALQQEIFRWFNLRHPMNRALVRICARRPGLQSFVTRLLDPAGRLAYRLGLRKVSNASYSAIYNLAYWLAILDEIGPDLFWSGVRGQGLIGPAEPRPAPALDALQAVVSVPDAGQETP